MEMYEIAVRCRGIHKDFGDGDARIEVLRGVDLTVRLGEMLFLVGTERLGQDHADLGDRRAPHGERR